MSSRTSLQRQPFANHSSCRPVNLDGLSAEPMRRIAPSMPISSGMYRHCAVITLGLTFCIALMADGEGRQAAAEEFDYRTGKAAEATKKAADQAGKSIRADLRRQRRHSAPSSTSDGLGADTELTADNTIRSPRAQRAPVRRGQPLRPLPGPPDIYPGLVSPWEALPGARGSAPGTFEETETQSVEQHSPQLSEEQAEAVLEASRQRSGGE